MEFVAKSDVGIKRKNNEDSYFAKKYNNDISLYIVADGLGGYEGGEIASKLLVIKMARCFEEHLNDNLKSEEVVRNVLQNSLFECNRQIHAMESSNEKYSGMGTTIVLVAIIYGEIYYLSVGDSRLYYIDENINYIKQITEDDTYVNELLRKNVIKLEEAKNHPQKHVLTKAIGVFNDLNIEVNKLYKDKGYLLLCTDGLTNMVEDNKILEIVKKTKFEKLADKYIEVANSNGGADNTTVVVVKL